VCLQVITFTGKAMVELSRCDVPRAGLREKGCIPQIVAYLRQGEGRPAGA
jgi:hypothetical protein